MEHTAYISLGSNLGDRIANLDAAIEQLRRCGTVVKISSWYETEPIEVTEQPWFINAVVELSTNLGSTALMRELLAIERKMGRVRGVPKGPRTVDLDLLLFDDETINMPGLSVPHPAMHQRRFVLEPLTEIAPDVTHPVLRKPAWKLLAELPQAQATRLFSPEGR